MQRQQPQHPAAPERAASSSGRGGGGGGSGGSGAAAAAARYGVGLAAAGVLPEQFGGGAAAAARASPTVRAGVGRREWKRMSSDEVPLPPPAPYTCDGVIEAHTSRHTHTRTHR
jgi:hypothetical protein